MSLRERVDLTTEDDVGETNVGIELSTDTIGVTIVEEFVDVEVLGITEVMSLREVGETASGVGVISSDTATVLLEELMAPSESMMAVVIGGTIKVCSGITLLISVFETTGLIAVEDSSIGNKTLLLTFFLKYAS